MSAKRLANPIFVGGLMQSGTSLVRKLLGRHSALYAGLETHWCTDEFREGWQDGTSRRQRWLAEFFELSDDQLAELRDEAEGYADYLDRVMSFCAIRVGKRRWVEKTPDNIRHHALIRELWPDAKVLHVVRDYRDVCASWKTNKGRQVTDCVEAAEVNLESLGELAHAATPWYHEVRYEELVTHTEVVLRNLCDFLSLSYESQMAEYGGDASEHAKILSVTGVDSSTARSLSRPIFSDSIGRWKAVLTPQEVSLVEERLGDPMRRWGMM